MPENSQGAPGSELELLDALARFCPTPAWVLFEDQVVFINDAAVRTMGASGREELLGRPLGALPHQAETRSFAYRGGTALFCQGRVETGPEAKLDERACQALRESLDYGVWICDAGGQNIYVSESFRKLIGFTQEQCNGYGWAEALHADRSALALAAWEECVQTGKKWDSELWFRGADRRWYPVLSRGIPVRDEAGHIVCWAGIIIDIRAFKDAQERLEEANDNLARSNKELEEFASSASHDLQEPLRVIRMMTRLIANRYKGSFDEDASAYLATIEASAARMTALVRDLLDYAYVLHTDSPDSAASDLNEAIEVALENCRPAIEEAAAIVSSDRLPVVMANGTRIARVFQNLISNAIKYRREDRPEIKISADRRGPEWRFCVADNGSGIAPDQQESIFRPFTRLHGQDTPGSGLGLAVCKKIVEHQGGRIWVESEPNVGSLFFFTLPVD